VLGFQLLQPVFAHLEQACQHLLPGQPVRLLAGAGLQSGLRIPGAAVPPVGVPAQAGQRGRAQDAGAGKAGFRGDAARRSNTSTRWPRKDSSSAAHADEPGAHDADVHVSGSGRGDGGGAGCDGAQARLWQRAEREPGLHRGGRGRQGRVQTRHPVRQPPLCGGGLSPGVALLTSGIVPCVCSRFRACFRPSDGCAASHAGCEAVSATILGLPQQRPLGGPGGVSRWSPRWWLPQSRTRPLKVLRVACGSAAGRQSRPGF
jgi:hypothetical protein